MSATGRTKRVDTTKIGDELAEHWAADACEVKTGVEHPGFIRATDQDGKPVVVRRTVRQRGDFYATPAETIRAILPALDLAEDAFILDAGSGDGAIAAELSKAFPRAEVLGIERDPELVEKARNRGLYNAEFLRGNFYRYSSAMASPDAIVMNPPYSHALEFVERALAIVKRGGTVAALLRVGFLGSETRREFNRRHPSDVYVLTRRPSFTGKGSDATDYAWFVWGPNRGHRWYPLTPEKKKRARKAKKKAPKTPRRAGKKACAVPSAAALPDRLPSLPAL